MQGCIILAIIVIEKDTLVFYLTYNSDKVNEALNLGQGYRVNSRCVLESMSRTLPMCGFITLADIGIEKHT